MKEKMRSVLQLLAGSHSHQTPRLPWGIAYARSLALLGRGALSGGTAQHLPLKATPSSPNLTQAQSRFIP